MNLKLNWTPCIHCWKLQCEKYKLRESSGFSNVVRENFADFQKDLSALEQQSTIGKVLDVHYQEEEKKLLVFGIF